MGPELDTARSSRSQRSLEASAHIKREALAFLADSGADLMSTKSLAERSGISTGPIYARYDIIEDLVLDLWVETLHAEFLSILSLIRNAVNENATEREELARLLHTPSTKAQAIVEVLSVMRRYPQLLERVGIDIGRAFSDHLHAQAKVAPSLALALCTVTFGAIFLQPIMGPDKTDRWMGSLSLLASAGRDELARQEPPRSIESPAVAVPIIATGDVVVDEFITAAMTVIARVGYENATATRIARIAGRGFSTIYNHYGTKEELMIAAVKSLIEQNIQMSFEGFAGLPRDEYITRSVGNALSVVSDLNRESRQLRIEALTSGRHHPEIARFASQGYQAMYESLREGIRQRAGDQAEGILSRVPPLWLLLRSNNIGMSLLANACSIPREIDWTPACASLYGLIGEIRSGS